MWNWYIIFHIFTTFSLQIKPISTQKFSHIFTTLLPDIHHIITKHKNWRSVTHKFRCCPCQFCLLLLLLTYKFLVWLALRRGVWKLCQTRPRVILQNKTLFCYLNNQDSLLATTVINKGLLSKFYFLLFIKNIIEFQSSC